MLSLNDIISFFKEAAGSTKLLISATIAFGAALVLVWPQENNELKISVIILFLFFLCMLLLNLGEKIYSAWASKRRQTKAWDNLTKDEHNFLAYYFTNKTKTRYIPCCNGTYTNSGIINLLISKGILYLGSNMSEFREENGMPPEQYFPINIHDKAYEFFITRFEADKND